MSNDEAEAIEAKFEKKWADNERHNFISRMERKLYRKERSGRTQ
ncbi:MAG TPA: hypothetical protein VN778_02060 [Verrucomicrobiae bacterium]|nr:hypothetical protein [Verrucomicrobiae bacterium]